MRQVLPVILIISIVTFSFFPIGTASSQTKKKKPVSKPVKQLSYKRDIAPIMKTYCLPCHTEDAMNPSRLYLDAYETMLAGGKHGPAFSAGKPDSSLIIRKISQTPPFGDPMPMKRSTPFPHDTLDILRTWILQGATNK